MKLKFLAAFLAIAVFFPAVAKAAAPAPSAGPHTQPKLSHDRAPHYHSHEPSPHH